MESHNVIRIANVDDPRLSCYRDLRGSERSTDGTFIAEGRFVVDRLIASPYVVDSLLLEDRNESQYLSRIPPQVPIYSLPRKQIAEIVGFDFHRGVMACGRRHGYADAENLTFTNDVKVALAVLGVDDQENMGSILRSAAALGVNQILLSPNTIDPFRRRVIRVSMANVLTHTFYRLQDPVADLEMLHTRGFRTIAGTLDEATDLDQVTHDQRPIVLMVGNEARGIDPELQRVASQRVRIPMRLGADSLNVAVATAIMIYEFTRPMSEQDR